MPEEGRSVRKVAVALVRNTDIVILLDVPDKGIFRKTSR
jgi:hypothetical protein